MNLELFIQAIERMGAIFVSYNEETHIMKIDIPVGCSFDDDIYIKRTARMLRKGIHPDAKLHIKRITQIKTIAFEDDINAMFSTMFSSIHEIDPDNFLMLRNEILRKCNITMQKLSDSIADGLIEGYSVEMQMDRVKKELGI